MAGKVYALSDLHGNLEIFLAMLEKIHFDDRDMLYILGDCNDRGDKAMEIYHLIRQHPDNMILLKGNHELMMRDFLLKRDWECPRGRLWQSNGGVKTLEQMERFLKKGCSCEKEFLEKRADLDRWMIGYVDSLPSFIELNVGGQELVLIHAGINPEASLKEQDEEICAWIRDWFYLSPAIKGKTIIFGHTPLCYINSNKSFDVWFDPVYQDKIGIDGGLGPFDNGQLNCLCLNDMSVTAIKKRDLKPGVEKGQKTDQGGVKGGPGAGSKD